jgi:hypothetical protein
MSHCSIYNRSMRFDHFKGDAMKVALAPAYRIRMFALLPATLGLGTAFLWARSLRWPSSLDADGMTLRYRRRVPWHAIKRIRVRRDYRDGHATRIDIHHHGSVERIPVRALEDGERVARVILSMFNQRRRVRTGVVADRGRAGGQPNQG